MTKRDIRIFIQEMESIGDCWNEEDVERVYGSKTLTEALEDRKSDITVFGSIIGTLLNR